MSQLYEIKNDKLTVVVNSFGGSLHSIKDCEGTEYLWQGDPAYWEDRAPNLFPYVARLTNGKYTFQGKEYPMDIHGFLKDSELALEKREEDYLELVLENNEVTEAQYPFAFRFHIVYQLKEDTLQVTFLVENLDEKTMYFGIGGHPGFAVPLEKGLDFTDYALVFGEEASGKAGTDFGSPAHSNTGNNSPAHSVIRVGFSKDCYVETQKDEPFPLEGGNTLPLHHDLFEQDAIVLRKMPRQVTLCSDKGKKAVCVTYPDMPYLGIWHMPHTDAPYVCIEPWVSLPSRKNVVEDLEEKEDLVRLGAGETYRNDWSIQMIF